jgi:pimeloyl-ACP methyl ester carboxylesterase
LPGWEIRGADRPILVGWSYGAAVAVHCADQNPGCAGVAAIDGAVPFGITGEEAQERIRRLFRRMRLMLPILRPLGMAARMSAGQHAEISNEVNIAIAPVLDRLSCPVSYIMATGASIGSDEQEMEQMRASLDPVAARNPNLTVSAKVTSNHAKILRNESRAIADAVRELATITDHADD